MNTYYCNFVGHYPVSASAVIVAIDKRQADRLLRRELKREGLLEKNPDKLDIIRVPHGSPQAIIIDDGDY